MDPLFLKKCLFDALQELVYLCYELDHAEGFKIVTRRLVYESRGHIKESNPSEHPHLCLPERVMSKSAILGDGACTDPIVIVVSLNAARANLRYQLHEKIYQVDEFLDSLCACKEYSLFEFALALRKTGVWPFERVLGGKWNTRWTLQEVLGALKSFDYRPPSLYCTTCSEDFTGRVYDARYQILDSFEGLCLDCINPNKSRDPDLDNLYNASRTKRKFRV